MEKAKKRKQNELTRLRFKDIRTTSLLDRAGKMKGRQTQEEFAEYLGVCSVTIRNYESGRQSIPASIIDKLCDDFGIRRNFLYGIDDFMTENDHKKFLKDQSYKKRILAPARMNGLIHEIISLLGYEESDSSDQEHEYFSCEIPIPKGYSLLSASIPQEKILSEFKKVNLHHHERFSLKRESDGKIVFLSDDEIERLYDDILDFIDFRLSKEFRG